MKTDPSVEEIERMPGSPHPVFDGQARQGLMKKAQRERMFGIKRLKNSDDKDDYQIQKGYVLAQLTPCQNRGPNKKKRA